MYLSGRLKSENEGMSDLLMSCEPFLYNNCEIWQEMKGLVLVPTLTVPLLSVLACVLPL